MTRPIFSMRGGLVLAIILMVVLTAVLGRRLTVRSDSPLSLVADDYRTGGGAGVVRWADRLDLPTHALQAPLWEVRDELSRPGNCLVTAGNGSWQPFSDELEPDQWHQIRRWVQTGNVLIVVTSEVHSLPRGVTDHFTTDAPGELEPKLLEATREGSWLDEKEVVNVATWWGGALAVERNGPRLQAVPDEWVLAGSSASAVLVRRPLGEGCVYLMLDEDAWSNTGFDRADNAASLARILRAELRPGGVLAIDHYRHGRGRVESFATFLLALPGAPAFCGMLLLIGLLWVWTGIQRLGPPEAFHETERRTAREYIEAVAALNLRARAAPLAVQAVVERVRHLAQQRGHVSPAGRKLIERAQALVRREDRPASPTREIKLIRDLIQLRRELYGTRPDTGPGRDDA
jgi:hypothetical protein